MVIDPLTFRRLCRAHALLTVMDAQPRSVREVARRAGISPFHFIRLFAALFGTTPHQLRRRARLERARQLLASGQPVTEVCMAVGLQSMGSFSSAFKRRTGESPAAFARRARKRSQAPGARACVPQAPGCLTLMAHLPESAFAISEKRARESP